MTGWSVGPYEIVQRQDVRIGTAERERTATLLSQHLTAGRLEIDEFDDRVKAVYAARTERELRVLLADLPSPQPPRRPRQQLPANRFLLALVVLAGVIVLATVAAFPPVLILPVLYVLLRHRRHRHYRMAATRWPT